MITVVVLDSIQRVVVPDADSGSCGRQVKDFVGCGIVVGQVAVTYGDWFASM